MRLQDAIHRLILKRTSRSQDGLDTTVEMEKLESGGRQIQFHPLYLRIISPDELEISHRPSRLIPGILFYSMLALTVYLALIRSGLVLLSGFLLIVLSVGYFSIRPSIFRLNRQTGMFEAWQREIIRDRLYGRKITLPIQSIQAIGVVRCSQSGWIKGYQIKLILNGRDDLYLHPEKLQKDGIQRIAEEIRRFLDAKVPIVDSDDTISRSLIR